MTDEKVFMSATVCFLVREGEVLLARKTRKIGAGCWNGYGGTPEEGESLPETAVRELFEESGLSVRVEDLEKIAIMDFHNTKSEGSVFVARVHFYRAQMWEGDVCETGEMATPTWFPIDQLPLDEMMPADRVFLPRILRGEKIVGSASYAPFQKELIGNVQISCVSELPEA